MAVKVKSSIIAEGNLAPDVWVIVSVGDLQYARILSDSKVSGPPPPVAPEATLKEFPLVVLGASGLLIYSKRTRAPAVWKLKAKGWKNVERCIFPGAAVC